MKVAAAALASVIVSVQGTPGSLVYSCGFRAGGKVRRELCSCLLRSPCHAHEDTENEEFLPLPACQGKQGQVTSEEYRDAVHHCREKFCWAKTQLELELPRTMGDHKTRGF